MYGKIASQARRAPNQFGRRIKVGSLALAFLAGGGGVASADDWGDTENNQVDGVGPTPDNGSEWYCYGNSLPNWMEDDVDVGMDAIEDSDATVQWRNDCPGWIDVRWEEGGLDPGTYGVNVCEDWHTAGTTCDRNEARLDVSNIRDRVDPWSNVTRAMGYRKVACHEAGHAVGNAHYTGSAKAPDGQNDCMRSGIGSSWITDTATYQNYSAHHKNHLNAWF